MSGIGGAKMTWGGGSGGGEEKKKPLGHFLNSSHRAPDYSRPTSSTLPG